SENLAIFTGNVSVVQGPTRMKAGTMKVYYVKDAGAAGEKADTKASGDDAATGVSPTSAGTNIDHLEIGGKVYIKSDDQVATGDRGTFDMKSQVLVLSGKKVVLTQGSNVLVGCKLTVQMKTGLAQVDSCGGRVMMSLTPSQSAQ